jgi:predicted transcriptional regulator
MPYNSEGVGYRDTDTSSAAAEDITPKAPKIRAAVLECLRASPVPLSTEDIAQRIGVIYASVQPRLSELRNDCLVLDSGRRGTTQYGKSCILWVAPALKTNP